MEEELKNLIKTAIREVISEYEDRKPKEVMSVADVCEYLGVSPAWFSTNKDKLLIPYFDAGGYKVYREDLEKWIEEQKQDVKESRPIYHSLSIKVAKKKLKIS